MFVVVLWSYKWVYEHLFSQYLFLWSIPWSFDKSTSDFSIATYITYCFEVEVDEMRNVATVHSNPFIIIQNKLECITIWINQIKIFKYMVIIMI